jgi:hypothetical protein
MHLPNSSFSIFSIGPMLCFSPISFFSFLLQLALEPRRIAYREERETWIQSSVVLGDVAVAMAAAAAAAAAAVVVAVAAVVVVAAGGGGDDDGGVDDAPPEAVVEEVAVPRE